MVRDEATNPHKVLRFVHTGGRWLLLPLVYNITDTWQIPQHCEYALHHTFLPDMAQRPTITHRSISFSHASGKYACTHSSSSNSKVDKQRVIPIALYCQFHVLLYM
ncbi:hypothetical protein ILYODFUR_016066 [Ilyodon furcidens]|uniref:Uncharacterized protein n=1 Tax=Ilyodon furcidens TaxID=33524 RepID=A0ABV0UVS8_9TELE